MKTATGADAGTVELPDDIFGIEPNVAVMHQVVTAQLAAKRRYAQHQDARRGARRRRQAVAAKGHRPRPPGLDPRRSGAAVVWRTAPSRATTRSAPPRRWCGSRCAPRCPTGPRVEGRRRRRLGDRRAEDQGRGQAARGDRPAHQGRARGARPRRAVPHRRGAWKSLRNLGERVQIVLPEELNTYDVLLNDWLVFSQPALETTIARLGDAKVSASADASTDASSDAR